MTKEVNNKSILGLKKSLRQNGNYIPNSGVSVHLIPKILG